MKLDHATLQGCNVLGLASFDSFEKTVKHSLKQIEMFGAKVDFVTMDQFSHSFSSKKVNYSALKEFIHYQGFDVVLVGLDGASTRTFYLNYIDELEKPIFISMYPGIIFREHINGFVDRSMADILCLNNCSDLVKYSAACRAFGVCDSNALVTGLPILWGVDVKDSPQDSKTLVYFDQPSVPDKRKQRDFVAYSLIKLAERHPDHKIIFKPRVKLGEKTLHRERSSIEIAFQRLGNSPKNLEVSHKSAVELISEASLVATVSSSAAVEAIAMGVTVKIISDFGVNETLGNVFYMDLGCFSTFDNLLVENNICSQISWLENNALCDKGIDSLVSAIAKLLDESPPRRRLDFYSKEWLEFMDQRDGSVEYSLSKRIAMLGVDLAFRLRKVLVK